MERRFGHDFSRVRLHRDSRAAESARSVHALAYTVGSSVVFGEGQYRPGSRDGQRLLAHELAHVVQQGHASGPDRALPIGPARDESEHAADRAAEAVLQGRPPAPATRGGLALQRQPAPSAPVKDPAPAKDDNPPPTQLALQVPVAIANFQAPIGGGAGVSSIGKPTSPTNSPYDSLYQPNIGLVLNWSLHKGPRGFELGFGLPQIGGSFGTGPSGVQFATYIQPTWVFFTWGKNDSQQLSAYVQPTASITTGDSKIDGKAVSVPVSLQYAYTMSQSGKNQWQFVASLTTGYNHTVLDNPPDGMPRSQDGAFIGIGLGFQFGRALEQYPKPPPEPVAPPPQTQTLEPPKPQQQQPAPPAAQPAPPAPAAPAAAPLPSSQEIFFALDLPHPGQGSGDLSVLSAAGRVNLATLARTLQDNPALKVQLIGTTSIEGPTEYNYDLGRRRAEWLAGQLGISPSRLANPATADLSGGCRAIGPGIVTCGATGADTKANPKDRRVLVRFVL